MYAWKKAISLILLVVLISCSQDQRSRSISIGTNPAGTFYYAVGTGLAKLFSENLGIRATAQPAAGSVVYVPLINNGEISLGFSTSIEAGTYYRGKMNLQQQPNLRVLMRFWQMPYGFMVRGNSNIKRMEDLRGKKVIETQSANLTLKIGNRSMLRAAKLNDGEYESITVGGLPQGILAVTDGLVDAAPIALGQGNVRKAHATTPGGIRFIDMSDIKNAQEFYNKQGQGFNTYRVTADDNFPGAPEGLLTGAVDIYLVASKAMTDQDAINIIELIEENWDVLENQFSALKRGSPVTFIDNNHTIPFHPGAIKYYTEISRWSDQSEERNNELLKLY